MRAGLIAYGNGDSNCSLSGAANLSDGRLRIVPTGDSRCTVGISLKGRSAVVGERSAACNYYCGPGADFAGRVLIETNGPARPVTDLAGDPLC